MKLLEYEPLRMKGQVMNTPITTQSSLPVWRRKAVWLALIPALGILCLAAIPPALSGEGNAGSSEARLQGSWLVTVILDIPDGPPPFEVLQSYADGGVVVGSDPSTFPVYHKITAFHGTWTQTGRREFAFTAIEFQYDDVEDGDPDGLYRLMVKEAVTVEPDGDTYNGKGTVEMYGPDGKLVRVFPDTTHGVRIRAE
jgi:hypothetical protein